MTVFITYDMRILAVMFGYVTLGLDSNRVLINI